MRTVLLTAIVGVVTCGFAFAQLGDFENTPLTPGFYLNAYPSYSTASKVFDQEGESQELPDNWTAFVVGFRPAYYGLANNHRWAVTALVPYASFDNGVSDPQSGIGDMQAAAAYWFLDNYNKWHNLSVWFWADIPTGDDENGLGTGQMNLRPGLAYCWDKYPMQIQSSVYYNLRMKNSDTEYKPGDELWWNFALGYGFQPRLSGSLEMETGWGFDAKLNDETITDSKETWFKVGPAFTYNLSPNFGFKVKGLYNAFGKNTAQSMDIWARLTYSFTK